MNYSKFFVLVILLIFSSGSNSETFDESISVQLACKFCGALEDAIKIAKKLKKENGNLEAERKRLRDILISEQRKLADITKDRNEYRTLLADNTAKLKNNAQLLIERNEIIETQNNEIERLKLAASMRLKLFWSMYESTAATN